MELDIYKCIQDADMVLVGLGEEFNGKKFLKEYSNYADDIKYLEQKKAWLIPAYNYYQLGDRQKMITEALNKLKDLLKDKNYFVISTSTNKVIHEIEWKHGYLTMPCGSMTHIQCENGCEGSLVQITAESELFSAMQTKDRAENSIENICDSVHFGRCEKCGAQMVLNNYYNEKYDESGYLDKWQLYTKWLQGTLNKKLLVLELGAEFDCPSVMRWPFEKIAFYNQKAEMFRINERLYQLTDDLKEKGCSIAQNAIEWLHMI